MLDDEQLMENARVTYDCFIQNTLSSTSHTLQWLPHRIQDPEFPAFNKEYFLCGTHYTEDHGELYGKDSIQIFTIRVPRMEKN